MPGIEWVNTVDNRSFVQGMNETQALFRRTSEILKSLGQNFNIDGIVNQYISLTKVIQDNEVAIRQSRESVLRWQEEAQKARDTGDFGTAETIQIDIDNELQKIQQLSEETDEYKRSVNELMGLWSNLEGKKAPMLFNSQQEYDHVQKLKAEIANLQSQIANFNGSDADLETLNGRLTELNDELNKSEISAAQNAANLGSLGPAAADASNKYYELTNKIKEQKIKVAELTIEHEKAKKAMKEANASGNLQAITDARTKYDALSQALINARHQLTNYQIEQSKVAGGIKNDAFSINSIVSQLKSSAMSLAGGLGLALGAKEFVGQVVGIRGQFQQLEIAFETMLGSGEKAKELLGQLTETAAKTPFDLQGVAQGAKQLMAYGISADEVNDTLVHLGDIAAGLSLPLGDLVYLYGTTMTQGRMFTQDLRQFMGRGIPIAEELAKIFNTTKENVGALVTAGKVGADEFKQAIMAMSSEGGKFAGLMENQSKTITGQISNIQDSIDVMFNEIGQNSEGIINGTLDVVSSLVENYEKVGKVIAGIVATYGTYRAALMTVTALQGLQTVGVGALTTAEAAHYGWLVLCEKAQKLLNAAMSVNPYVLVATAVAGLVSTMIVFHKETESVSDVIDRANSKVAKSFAEVDAQIKTEQQSIDELFNRLRKAEKGTNEYKEVKDQILSQYGKYLQGLNNEIATLNDVEGAYKAVAKAARDAALARGKEAAISQANSEYTKNYSDAMGKIYDIIKDKRGEQIAKTAIDVIKKDLKDAGEVAEDTQRTLHKYGVGYSLFGELNKAEQGLKASTSKINLLFGEQGKVVAETSENVTKLSEDYEKAETRYKRAQRWVQAIEKNKADYTTKEYQDALEDLKEAKNAFEKIGGKTSNKVKTGSSFSNAQTLNAKQLQDQWKHEEEMTKLETDAARARQDASIAAIQNQAQRERAEREAQYHRTIEDLKRQEDDIYKAIYEQRKKEYELNNKDKKYENTQEGRNGWQALKYNSVESVQEAEKQILIELGKGEIMNALQEQFGSGNVDVLARPMIDAAKLAAKGWKDAGDGIATVFSSQFGIEDKEGNVHEILVTPILPDGTVLSERELERYIDTKLQGAEDILKADELGIVIAVDVSEDGSAGEKLHQLHEQLVDLPTDKLKEIQLLYENIGKARPFDDSELKQYQLVMDTINAKVEEATENDRRRLLEIQQQQVQSLRDYLKEYGTLEQQKYAIAEEYEEKIKRAREAGNEGEAKILEKQRDSAVAGADARALAMDIDWGQMFSGIGNVLSDLAKETYQKVSDYMKSDDFKKLEASDKKAYIDLQQELANAGGAPTSSPFKQSTWDEIDKLTKEYQTKMKAFVDASDTHKQAADRLKEAQDEYNKAIKDGASTTELAIKEANVKVAENQFNQTGEVVQETKNDKDQAGQNLKTKTDAAAQGLQNFTTVLNNITSGSLKGAADGISGAIMLIAGKAEKAGEGLLGAIGGKAGGLIGAILQIIDALGDDPAQFLSDLIDRILGAVDKIIDQLLGGELIQKLITALANGVMKIVTTLVENLTSILSFGLFSFGGKDNHQEMLDRQEKYNKMIDSTTKSLEKFTEALQKSFGVMAIQNSEEAERMIRQNMATEVSGLLSAFWDNYGGGHSDIWHANKALNDQMSELWTVDSVHDLLYYAQKNGLSFFDTEEGKLTWNQLLSGNAEDIAKFFKDIRDNDSEMWRVITTEMGHTEKTDWIEKLIDTYEQLDENQKELMERLTTTSEDNVFDDFMDSLYNLADGSEDVMNDIADNWQKMVNKMVVNNLVGNQFQDDLKAWYKKLADTMKKRTEDGNTKELQNELDGLKDEYNDYVAAAQAQIEQLREMGIIQASSDATSQEQSASVQAMERITTDQAEELIGRMNAGQMIWQQGNDQRVLILQSLASMQEVVSGNGRSFSEMVTLMQTANSHLQSIYENNKKSYLEFKDILERMTHEISNI